MLGDKLVTWQCGLLGQRVGEAAHPGPVDLGDEGAVRRVWQRVDDTQETQPASPTALSEALALCVEAAAQPPRPAATLCAQQRRSLGASSASPVSRDEMEDIDGMVSFASADPHQHPST